MSMPEQLIPTVDTLPPTKELVKQNVVYPKSTSNGQSKKTIVGTPKKIIYPERDGKPMADNTVQFEKIALLKKNFDILYENDPNVFVAGDLLWYPVEGSPGIRQAPDVMIAFGSPKGDRGSYRQWEEQGIAPQVAFEVISPGNRVNEMSNKRRFYQRYGVQEYYEYDPQKGTLRGWLSQSGRFQEIGSMIGWQSPLLGVSFEMEDKNLQVYNPDGTPFLTHEESDRARRDAEKHASQEEKGRIEAEERAREEEQARVAAEKHARLEKWNRLGLRLRSVLEKWNKLGLKLRSVLEKRNRLGLRLRSMLERRRKLELRLRSVLAKRNRPELRLKNRLQKCKPL